MFEKFASVFVIMAAVVGYWLMVPKPRPWVRLRYNAEPEYDIIIVGGGTAGSVLADRLTEFREESQVRVLVLEAGTDGTHIDLEIPMDGVKQWHTEEHDWMYKTVKQDKACHSSTDQRCHWPSGKTLGGNSALGSLLYSRGNKGDYDSWAAVGLEGWSYDDVLPYFVKAEDMQDSELLQDGYHGKLGPQAVSVAKTTPVAEYVVEAAKELGYDIVDYNADKQEGFGLVQATIMDGKRWSTARGYLWPSLKRKNLHTVVHAQVTKVLIENKTAIGVEYIKEGVKHTVLAKQEVILSAGPIESPHLLMLSGIGPKKELEDQGIPVYANVPGVGKNLQDHVKTWGPELLIDEAFTITESDLNSQSSQMEYDLFGTGPRTSANGIEAIGYVRTKHQPVTNPHPDAELAFLARITGSDMKNPHYKETFSFSDEIWNNYYANRPKNQHGITLLATALKPRSVGHLRLQSKDPSTPPLIQPNYFANDHDVKVTIDAIRHFEKFAKSGLFSRIGGRLRDTSSPFPPCAQHPAESDAYWRCYIKYNTVTMGHYVGTCKMGMSNDPMSVVDNKLRVRGVKNLRVIDASVMPSIPSGGTLAPTVMIAEKASDLIKGRIITKKLKLKKREQAKQTS